MIKELEEAYELVKARQKLHHRAFQLLSQALSFSGSLEMQRLVLEPLLYVLYT